MRPLVPIVLAFACLAAAAPAAGAEWLEPEAVRVRVTEADLNRILVDAFRATGGPVYAGEKERVSRSVHGLRYAARLSDPVLDLGSDGAASLRFDVLEADVRIERLERRLIGRLACCEGAGLTIGPEHPLGMSLDLRFVAEGGDLRIRAESAASSNARRAVQLVKPERCRNAPLPTWLLWALGKPQLRRRVGQLDEILVTRARKSADELADRGLLRERFRVGGTELALFPGAVTTGDGALEVLLGATSGTPPAAGVGPPAPLSGAPGSYVAISERLVNGLLDLAFVEATTRERRPGGQFRKLFRSTAAYTLIPGLRDLESTDGLVFRVGLDAPPRVRFAPRVDGAGALVTIEVSGVHLEVLEERAARLESLGRLTVERGRVTVAPRPAADGVVLDLVDNEWHVTSSGIEFDEPLLGATIQELVFGELLETRVEPLASGGLLIGSTPLVPVGFAADGGWLVISLAVDPPPGSADRAEPPIARRTDSPRGSR